MEDLKTLEFEVPFGIAHFYFKASLQRALKQLALVKDFLREAGDIERYQAASDAALALETLIDGVSDVGAAYAEEKGQEEED